MDDTERVGQRIAAARKTMGLTQQGLATAAKVSKSMLAKVESGHASASTGWIGAVAKVLAVDVAYLTGGPNPTGDTDNVLAHRLITGVRRALAAWDLPEPPDNHGTAPYDIARLAEEVTDLGVLRRQTSYSTVASRVPALLTSLRLAAKSTEGRDQETVYGLLASTYRAANSLAHKLGYLDLSLMAIERMDWAASRSGDELLPPMVDYLRAAALARLGDHRSATHLLTRAIDRLAADAGNSPEVRAVIGCLHMKLVSIYGTIADSDRVDVHLAEAERLAQGDGARNHVVYETYFGPTNVALHALSARVDLGQPGQALAVANATHIPDGTPRERATYFYTDLARAHLLNGNSDGAIEALYEARAVAPLHFANSSVARGAIYAIATGQRRATTGLRALANTVGIRD